MSRPGSSEPPRPFRTPGLVDQHCHGFAGVDFATAPTSDVVEALRALYLRGVTRVVASVPTMPAGDMLAAIKRLTPLVGDGALAGIHLEGPFLSAARCGAQSPDDLLEPGTTAARELVASFIAEGSGLAGGNAIVAMTYAPELEGADGLERALGAAGILPSPGHTNATAGQFDAAVERLTADWPGPRRPAVTHLFNAMPGFHHRDPGPIPTALRAAVGRTLRLELVADGHHVDPSVVVDVLRLAPGSVCVVSDASAATGTAPGRYRLGAVPIEAATGRAPSVCGTTDNTSNASSNPRRQSGPLASGAVALDGALANLLAWGIPPELAVPTVTTNPASGVPPERRDSGRLEWDATGQPAVVVPPLLG